MKDMFKDSAKFFGRTILVSLLCFFIVISIMVITVGFFAVPAGYYVTGTKDGKQENLYTYYTADGEDTKYALYEEQGYTLEKTEIKLVPESSERTSYIISQLFCLAILYSFIYPHFWDRGYRDRNLAQTGNIKGNKLKGLYVGLMTIVPWGILLLALHKVQGLTISLLMFICPIFYPTINLITKGNIYFSQLSIPMLLGVVACLFIIPLFSWLGYYLGFKDYSIMEKITFVKTK